MLGFVLISFINIVIGELVPKRLALPAPALISGYVSMPMMVFTRITAPFVWLPTVFVALAIAGHIVLTRRLLADRLAIARHA